MKSLWKDMSFFLTNKIYMMLVSIVAVGSYGFAITHQTIGIDDTAIGMYFGEDGLAPAMGRWVIYLLNKLISLDAFLPWMTELIAVMIFLLSVTLWCVLWYRIVGNQVHILGYAIFSALFISCPLISEVFVYYLHNGICLAYGLTALSLLLILEAMKECKLKARILYVIASIALLTTALGCYESFIIVYIMGMIFMFFLLRKDHKDGYTVKVLPWMGALVTTVAACVMLRSVLLRVLRLIFGYSIPDSFTVGYRNIFENLGQSKADFFMAIKKFWVMYYLNGVCYLPITVLVLAIAALICFAIYKSVRQKDILLVLSMLAVPFVPVTMVLIEGMPTHYRASQYVPLIGAFAIFLAFKEWNYDKMPKGVSVVAVVAAFALIWNQSVDMNRWFYVDYLKYEDTKTVMNHIAYDLESKYDLLKPVVFRGPYDVPYEIAKDAYLSFSSDEYRFMKSVADMVDVHLLEKFNGENGRGYVFAETPVNSTLRWGITAFDGTAKQLQAFWEMHGYGIKVETDLEKIAEAEALRIGMPTYPKEGYIKETEEYIIVNF